MNISIIKIINIHTLFISEYMYMQNLVKIYSLIKIQNYINNWSLTVYYISIYNCKP